MTNPTNPTNPTNNKQISEAVAPFKARISEAVEAIIEADCITKLGMLANALEAAGIDSRITNAGSDKAEIEVADYGFISFQDSEECPGNPGFIYSEIRGDWMPIDAHEVERNLVELATYVAHRDLVPND